MALEWKNNNECCAQHLGVPAPITSATPATPANTTSPSSTPDWCGEIYMPVCLFINNKPPPHGTLFERQNICEYLGSNGPEARLMNSRSNKVYFDTSKYPPPAADYDSSKSFTQDASFLRLVEDLKRQSIEHGFRINLSGGGRLRCFRHGRHVDNKNLQTKPRQRRCVTTKALVLEETCGFLLPVTCDATGFYFRPGAGCGVHRHHERCFLTEEELPASYRPAGRPKIKKKKASSSSSSLSYSSSFGKEAMPKVAELSKLYERVGQTKQCPSYVPLLQAVDKLIEDLKEHEAAAAASSEQSKNGKRSRNESQQQEEDGHDDDDENREDTVTKVNSTTSAETPEQLLAEDTTKRTE